MQKIKKFLARNRAFKKLHVLFFRIFTTLSLPFKKFILFLNQFKFIRNIIFNFLLPNKLLIQDIDNIKFTLSTDDFVNSRKIYVTRSFPQLDVFESILKLLKNLNYKIDTIVDIGAHYGNIIVPAMIMFDFNKGFAVEPISKNFDILKINLALNNLEEKVTLFNNYLDEDESEVHVDTFKNNSAAAISIEKLDKNSQKKFIRYNNLNKGEKNVLISNTINNLFKGIQLKNSIFWIYAQGKEFEIIKGGSQILNRAHPLVISFVPYLLSKNIMPKNIVTILTNLGYSKFKNIEEKNNQFHLINEETVEFLFQKYKYTYSSTFLLII